MSNDSTERTHAEAVDVFQQLGLTDYEARSFVALVRLDHGTAREVSEIADVPRTRVYDAMEGLENLGLVDIQYSTPKRFWAVSTETTGQKFRRTYNDYLTTLSELLTELEPATAHQEQYGVWTVTDHETIEDRVLEFLNTAEDEIVYMTVETLLSDLVIERLAAAAERGVQIRLAGISKETHAQIQEQIPNAELFESLWEWSDTPAGRLMMIDQEKVLTSVLLNMVEGEDAGAAPTEETAIWGSGETNSLVVVLKAIFTWRLNPDRESATD